MPVIQSTFDVRYRTAIEVSYGTGLRIFEVVAIRIDDFDTVNVKGFIQVRCGKGSHEHMTYLLATVLTY